MQSSVSIRQLDLNFGAVSVLRQLDLDVYDGEFLVLLGPSGCGKSTLLNCIAGLLDVSAGQIEIKGRNVTWEEPGKRGIGMVFQSYALYPQMTVEGNLSFGLKNARMPGDEIRERVARAAEILQLTPLLKRKPGALSGGQRQRVAIGRALVRDVDVFLFDEPLSNLDARLRVDLRVELKRLHRRLKNTIIYVTHDQIEAMTLADRIAIMQGGAIQQLGSPDEIYNRPMNKYVADFIGSPSMNFLAGQLHKGHVRVGAYSVNMAGYEFSAEQSDLDVWLGVRPEHILTQAAAEMAMFQTEVQVEIVEPMGADTLVLARMGSQSLRVRLDGQTRVRIGDRLKIGINPANTSLFDRGTGLRL